MVAFSLSNVRAKSVKIIMSLIICTQDWGLLSGTQVGKFWREFQHEF